jgi:pyruvate kinase
LKKGCRILIDDGRVELRVEKIQGHDMYASVVTGGTLTSHKGMNFPDTKLSIPPFTSKDQKDVVFGIEQGVDWFALSFVNNRKQVLDLKRLIARKTAKGLVPARVIVKIETREAIENFKEILDASDAIMIARGDLGLEIPQQEVPIHQKEIIEKCRLAGKPVVVATQMLDSMMHAPRPTRAEVSDVANAVFDHADALMLSGETATGKFPRQVVEIMSQIIQEAETSVYDDVKINQHSHMRLRNCDAIVASHILAPGSETLLLERPEIPLFLAVASDRIARQVALRWGIQPFVMKRQTPNTFLSQALKQLRGKRFVKKGMRIAVVMDDQQGKRSEIFKVR